MRYEDYNMGDMVFNTKEDWTDEEKKEFLDTCPEGKDNEKKKAVLEQMLIDIENNVLKLTKYKEIHFKSAESYAKGNEYLSMRSRRYCKTKNLCIMIDGIDRYIERDYHIKQLLELMDNLTDRFENITRIYKEKEEEYRKENEEKQYEKTNAERIEISSLAAQWLNNMRISVPDKIEKDDSLWRVAGYYNTYNVEFNGYNYCWKNKYGELEFGNTPVTKEDAEYIVALMKESSAEIVKIINKCKTEITTIMGKYEKK